MSQVSDSDIKHYEGLVRKTASMYAGIVEDDFDDICAVLRIKVWQALKAFDPAKARQTRDAYVFMCVRNRVKDLVKKVRRDELFIEDIAPSDPNRGLPRDTFERRYFSVQDDELFEDLDKPLIPSTLTAQERLVVGYLYLSYTQPQMAVVLEMPRKEVAALVGNVKLKFADWKPEKSEAVLPAEVLA